MAVLVFMLVAYAVSRALRRLDVVDVAWGLGFVVIAATGLVVGAGSGSRVVLVTILVSAWGLRLAGHIFKRRLGKPEDKRYVAMKESWNGPEPLEALTRIFLSQGLLMLIIAIPVMIVASTNRTQLNLLDYVGATIWLIGYFFEVVGDQQLASFIANPTNKGKLMTSGLWRYTRHPNYFGEVTQWWGIFLIAVSVPYGWLGIVGPAVITFLILKVSGVPLLEKHKAGQPEWEAYKARTSKFIPLPPRKA